MSTAPKTSLILGTGAYRPWQVLAGESARPASTPTALRRRRSAVSPSSWDSPNSRFPADGASAWSTCPAREVRASHGGGRHRASTWRSS